MLILGIDPGLAATGWGLIDSADGARVRYCDGGVIQTRASDNHVERLELIYRKISAVVTKHQPQVACVERVFANLNGKSSMALGEARGATIAALVHHHIPIAELSALQIKKSITGRGRADKKEVAKMVLLMLDNAPANIRGDAADALACALSYIPISQMQTNESLTHYRMSARRSRRRISRRRV